MRVTIFQSFLCLFLASTLAPSADAADCNTTPKPPETNNKFKVYVETNYLNQPDLLSKYGIEDLPMVYGHTLWKKGQDLKLLPSKDYVIAKVKDYVAKRGGLNNKYLTLDIEHWPMSSSNAQITSSVNKLITVLGWAESAAPQTKMGYYTNVPTPGGWWAANLGGTSWNSWVARNNLTQPLANKMEGLFPNLYAPDANFDKWIKGAKGIISEARRLAKGKPVYLVINPRYHPKASGGLSYKLIPQDFFALQLKTIKEAGANGVVIWGADNYTKDWSENLPWWQATKAFLSLK